MDTLELQHYRYSSQSKSTLGVWMIEHKFTCHVLEDTFRAKKIKKETRISAGRYEITLRDFGSHYTKYKEKYPLHKGMLWLRDVTEFTDILFHIGTKDKDSWGCILAGSTANCNNVEMGKLTDSTGAYLRTYFEILKQGFDKGKRVFITITDLDVPYQH
tara:strand:+ start:505 stop:981 length:477 start_codon:yes stop_codon:yes gene_type:complete